ncbi:hypothetical protein GCM10011514_35660 [Emticicia aquatilis]|uniref:Uncharacterized protein n=1 Tax=Emticicia aquatilis TaxID=1537369 RepID=A0A916YZ35_9BACT|nr:hypothetical protein [Emticicia aquatilis]GGD68426.1 hypothetical protein GCM10011514_35660 [Emticicia aquatilis]
MAESEGENKLPEVPKPPQNRVLMDSKYSDDELDIDFRMGRKNTFDYISKEARESYIFTEICKCISITLELFDKVTDDYLLKNYIKLTFSIFLSKSNLYSNLTKSESIDVITSFIEFLDNIIIKFNLEEEEIDRLLKLINQLFNEYKGDNSSTIMFEQKWKF